MHVSSAKSFIGSATARLAATYLVIIMVMSLGFSGVIYGISSQQLGRQLPPRGMFDDSDDRQPGFRRQRDLIDQFLVERIQEGRRALLARLVALNVSALLLGGGLSYVLARRTLQPIEDAMEAQSQFVSDASHELRTPITALQATNEVALRDKKLTVESAKELIGHNVAEAKHLRALTDGLLSLLKEDTKAFPIEAVSVQSVVAQAMTHVIQPAQDKHIGIIDQTPNVLIRANQQGLEQVLTILLDNAIKYSPAKSAIQVSAIQKTRFLYISVQDQGIGIKASDLPYIFKRFYRADKARTRQSPDGYGLGLAIAQKITHQMHGTISVQSQIDSGSTFTVRLPLQKTE